MAVFQINITMIKVLINIEEEMKLLHEYFYKIDKRIDDEKIYNYRGKNLVVFCKIMKINY